MKSPVIKLACSDLQHTRSWCEVTGLKMKSPDVNLGDQVIRDRRSKHIAEDEGGADYEGGRRDHREGVYEDTLARQSSRDRTPGQLCTE